MDNTEGHILHRQDLNSGQVASVLRSLVSNNRIGIVTASQTNNHIPVASQHSRIGDPWDTVAHLDRTSQAARILCAVDHREHRHSIPSNGISRCR